jgi:hypothetical protein
MTVRIIETNDAPLKKVDVDGVTVDLIENALRNAREEMDAVLFRTAMSPGIREQGDCFPDDRQPRRQDGRGAVRFLHRAVYRPPTTTRSRRAMSSSPTIRTCVTRRCRTCRTGLCSCRSSRMGGTSPGRRCSVTCRTTAAWCPAPCPSTRRRSSRKVSASRRPSCTRRACCRGHSRADPAQRAYAAVEPLRSECAGCGLQHRRETRAGACRAFWRRGAGQHHGRDAAAQLRRHEAHHRDVHPRGAAGV